MTDTSDRRATPGGSAPRSIVVAAVLLDATPDWDRVTDVLAPGNNESPAFRHRVVDVPFGLEPPRWTGDPHTDPPWRLDRVSLVTPVTFDSVLEFARAAPPVPDLRHPMWDLTLLDGLTGGQSALVIRLHHLAPSEDPDDDSVWSWARSVSGHGAESVRSATRGLGRTATALVKTLLGEPDEDEQPDHGTEGSHYRLHVVDIPLADLRAAAEHAGCGLDSAFVAAMLLACAEYRRRHGKATDDLHAAIPVSGGEPVRVGLGDDTHSPDDLMRRIEAGRPATSEGVNAHAADLHGSRGEPVAALSNTDELFGPHDVFTATLPGSTAPLYVGGAKIERYYGFCPTHGAAFSATLMSYRTGCCIGVTVDATAVPDREVFDECLRVGIRAVAGQNADENDLSGHSG